MLFVFKAVCMLYFMLRAFIQSAFSFCSKVLYLVNIASCSVL